MRQWGEKRLGYSLEQLNEQIVQSQQLHDMQNKGVLTIETQCEAQNIIVSITDNGSINFTSEPGRTTFTVIIPIC